MCDVFSGCLTPHVRMNVKKERKLCHSSNVVGNSLHVHLPCSECSAKDRHDLARRHGALQNEYVGSG
ncbi:hypothetical protein B0O80DRAFT_251127 [Mortierella sp. GBAus27b]|nr:hypothetical protein B0O80DRAFT_251127 [Mortierella sp. GBAus27b]